MLEEIDDSMIILNKEKLLKINSFQATKLRRTMINYLFQSYALINNIIVYDNLKIAWAYILLLLLLFKKTQVKQIDEVLNKLHLTQVRNVVVNTLLSGEQQCLALAICILNAKILF